MKQVPILTPERALFTGLFCGLMLGFAIGTLMWPHCP